MENRIIYNEYVLYAFPVRFFLSIKYEKEKNVKRDNNKSI